jgi:hypothetical protein
MPAYNSLLLALDGHSNTSRCSPVGAFTLMQPVVRAKSFPNYASKAVCHCSRSPLYLLVEISRVVSLWMYNQHDRWGSKVTLDARVFVGIHFSVGFFDVDGCVVVGGIAGYLDFSSNFFGGGF